MGEVVKTLDKKQDVRLPKIQENLFYIKDGINYLVYDGETLSEVTGYIPTTTISRIPSGGGSVFESVNMLSKYRKNSL